MGHGPTKQHEALQPRRFFLSFILPAMFSLQAMVSRVARLYRDQALFATAQDNNHIAPAVISTTPPSSPIFFSQRMSFDSFHEDIPATRAGILFPSSAFASSDRSSSNDPAPSYQESSRSEEIGFIVVQANVGAFKDSWGRTKVVCICDVPVGSPTAALAVCSTQLQDCIQRAVNEAFNAA